MELNIHDNLDALHSEVEEILSSNVDGKQSDLTPSVVHEGTIILENCIWATTIPICLPSKQHFSESFQFQIQE